MTIDLSTLNAAQRDAVLFTEGPCLVIAAAGTGKTRVLTYRIARLVEEGFAHPNEILAVTFTNKAAKEMAERLEKLLGSRARGIWAVTFHSFCVRVIREHADKIGLTRAFTIYDTDDSKRLIKKLMKEAGYEEGYAKPGDVSRIMSSAANRMEKPSSFGGGPAHRVAEELYDTYRDALIKANSTDFDGLILGALQIFKENPSILHGYQERFRYLLADENQDVNPPQALLLKLLAAKYRNIMVVGDEDQCFPAGTMVMTPSGPRAIETLSVGDEVISGTGKGHTAAAAVTATHLHRHNGAMVTLKTSLGYTLTGTPDHKVPVQPGASSGDNFVYLMYRPDLGYRIGQVKASGRGSKDKSDLLGHVRRCRQESASKMWLLLATKDKTEATYFEHLWSYRYGIPKLIFKVKGREMGMSEEQVHRVFHELDTEKGALSLLSSLGFSSECPHYIPDATVRGGVSRTTVNLRMFGGHPRKDDIPSKKQAPGQPRPWHAHVIEVSSSYPGGREALLAKGFVASPTGKGEGWSHKSLYSSLPEAESKAREIADILDGSEVKKKIMLLPQKKGMQLLPLAAIHPGSVIVVINDDGSLEEDMVIESTRTRRRTDVYGLSVASTENYFADGICVSNCIYTFRASDPKYILEFASEWPEAVTIKLEQNYRSTGCILDIANALISNNTIRRPKTMFTDKGRGEKALGFIANDDRDEAWKVVREMERLMREERYDYSDFAVFYRTNAQSRQLEDAFLKAGVPYKIVGGTRYFDRAEVRDLMAYLKVLANPADGISLRRIVNVPRRGIGDTSLNKLDAWARERGWTLWQAMEETALGMGPLPKRATESIYEFTRLIDGMRKAAMPREGQVDVAVAVQAIIEKTGMVEAYEALGDNESLGRAENVAEFLNVAIEFGSSHPEATLADFVEWLALRTDLDEVEEGASHAVLMTVHTAKGLEFPCVFVTGLEEEVFPHINSINEGAAQLEEERRLAYVALSRAERHLVLLRARQRMSFGQIRYNKPSRFLAEIPPECLEAEEGFAGGREAPAGVFGGGARSGASRGWRGGTSRQGTGTGSSLPRPAAAPKPAAKPAEHWAKGTRVRHKAFGLGTVTVAGTDSVEVRFDDGSRKKLMPAYAPMERIS